MNRLAQHIKALLLKHDCVVLPQFGTFFIDERPAGLIGDGVFAPAQRNIRFTPEIDETDNLLVRSMMDGVHLTQEQAENELNALIADAGQALATTGTLDFDTLGVFTLVDGHVTFSPCLAGLVLPDGYGLETFVMPLLPGVVASHEESSADVLISDSGVMRLRRVLLHYTLITIITILFSFIFNIPLGYEKTEPIDTSLTGMFIPQVDRPDIDCMTTPTEINRTSRGNDSIMFF